MNKSIEQVKEFHETVNHPVGDLTVLEPLATRQLRIKLIFEELQELAEASDCIETFRDLCEGMVSDEDYLLAQDGNNVNQLEELDALCDIQYVLNGKILTAGMHEIFDKNFDLVHINNMAKAHDSWEQANETILKSCKSQGSLHEIGTSGKYLVRNSAGKIIKPHNHKKVLLTLK